MTFIDSYITSSTNSTDAKAAHRTKMTVMYHASYINTMRNHHRLEFLAAMERVVEAVEVLLVAFHEEVGGGSSGGGGGSRGLGTSALIQELE